MKFKLFSFCFLFISLFSKAQNSYEFLQLSGENVSTQSITYDIKQDKIGNLWIASEEGVLKHNSNYYKIYNTYNGLPQSLNNRATEVFIDSDNNVWVGFENGLCFYNKDLDKFELIENSKNISPSLITSIREKNKNIWVGGFNGLWNYNSETKKLARFITNISVETFLFFENHILIGSTKGLYIVNLDDSLKKAVKLDTFNEKVSFIGEINNQILIGTKSGNIYQFNKTSKTASLIPLKKQFSSPITDIIESEYKITIATDGDGIYETDKNYAIINHFSEDTNNQNSISSNGVYDLEKSNENILWIATYGGGINYLNNNRQPFKKFNIV
ncbi:ligand-binding sensor domain-containing protein [Polaribacter aestuariivivens]|uniref:ligand-binding sensor domain-containing protein n=1 Tax=Polaribacter aestuariivivens TaxID=2304626 RepID=UPI003F49A140